MSEKFLWFYKAVWSNYLTWNFLVTMLKKRKFNDIWKHSSCISLDIYLSFMQKADCSNLITWCLFQLNFLWNITWIGHKSFSKEWIGTRMECKVAHAFLGRSLWCHRYHSLQLDHTPQTTRTRPSTTPICASSTWVGGNSLGVEIQPLHTFSDFNLSISVRGKCGQSLQIVCEALVHKTLDLVSVPELELRIDGRKLKTMLNRSVDKVAPKLTLVRIGEMTFARCSLTCSSRCPGCTPARATWRPTPPSLRVSSRTAKTSNCASTRAVLVV